MTPRARYLGGWAEALGLAPGMEVRFRGRSVRGFTLVEAPWGHLLGIPNGELVLVRGPHEDVTDEARSRAADRRLVRSLTAIAAERPGAEP